VALGRACGRLPPRVALGLLAGLFEVYDMQVTAYALAERYLGIREVAGPEHHPLIQLGFWLCTTDGYGYETPDEVPWCSAGLQVPFWQLGLPRSKSARARSWLDVGREIALDQAARGYDVVVLSRGSNPTAGHVGLYHRHEGRTVTILGGNQGDAWSLADFPRDRIVAVRRVYEDPA